MPIKEFLQLLLNNSKKQDTNIKQKKYQEMIGSPIFLIVKTKLDIIFATSLVSHFIKNLNHQYTKVTKTIFKYLKRLKDRRIIYKISTLNIKKYFDLD